MSFPEAQDFLVSSRAVERAVTADRKRACSGDEIAAVAATAITTHVKILFNTHSNVDGTFSLDRQMISALAYSQFI